MDQHHPIWSSGVCSSTLITGKQRSITLVSSNHTGMLKCVDNASDESMQLITSHKIWATMMLTLAHMWVVRIFPLPHTLSITPYMSSHTSKCKHSVLDNPSTKFALQTNSLILPSASQLLSISDVLDKKLGSSNVCKHKPKMLNNCYTANSDQHSWM